MKHENSLITLTVVGVAALIVGCLLLLILGITKISQNDRVHYYDQQYDQQAEYVMEMCSQVSDRDYCIVELTKLSFIDEVTVIWNESSGAVEVVVEADNE